MPLVAFESVGLAQWAPRDYSAFAREGMMQNAIVYRSVRMIAEAAASVPLLLYEGDAEIESHPLLDLLKRPAPGMTGTDMMEAFLGFLLVSGNAYVQAVSLGGEIRELHVLRPDRMRVVPGADGWPAAWEYQAGGDVVRIAGEAADGVASVLHLKLFHPADDYYGLSPIEAAATAVDIHNAAARWTKALLDNSARPSGALVYTTGGQLTADQFARLKSELETSFQGAQNAGRPLLLEGGLDWKAMSLSPRDMDFMEAKHAAAREIALAIGVPPMLLGIPGDNTYSNYQEAQRSFWRQTVIPLVARAARAFAGWLAPAWGGELRLVADLDAIEALAPERDALWTRLEKASFLTRDEKRAAAGYGGEGRSVGQATKFRPDQPHVPAGNPNGGQWTDDNEGGPANAFRLVWEDPIEEPSVPPGSKSGSDGTTDQSSNDGDEPGLPVVQVAQRLLTGPGHQLLTNQTARAIGNFSKDALSVFDDAFAESGGRIPVEGHLNSTDHHRYNQRQLPFVQDWLNGNNSYGRQIDPSQMTKSEARELLKAINRDPEMSKFNSGVYSKSIMQGLRRMPPRGTE